MENNIIEYTLFLNPKKDWKVRLPKQSTKGLVFFYNRLCYFQYFSQQPEKKPIKIDLVSDMKVEPEEMNLPVIYSCDGRNKYESWKQSTKYL